ncbi:MAG: aminoglycoside phosphotransferase family protein [Chloroflexaceae bacterium]|nr:aminoglycoside phosphotransferase family protein [Chloroflexaceae bacterium]
MELEPALLSTYLSEHFGAPVEVLELASLGGAAPPPPDEGLRPGTLKILGYGEPVLIRYRVNGEERRAVLHTMAANQFGHERRADRAANMILSYDCFNDLPRHVRALDVGVLDPDGCPRSIGAGEVFLLTDYAEGQIYAEDLKRMVATGRVGEEDLARARALALYLSEIHQVRRDEPALYRRHLRDVFGSGEGIAGLIDSYPPDYALAPAAWLERVETRLVAWRNRLKAHPERLAQIHGDFHPFNVLFSTGTHFTLLDRSRGPWGEPADDVSAMAINYLFFSLQRSGALASPFDELWTIFWQTYLAHTGDELLLRVVQPFLIWRALVIASPLWYNVADEVRRSLFHFIERLLEIPVFDPGEVGAYLR